MREKASRFGLDADTVRFFNSQWVPDTTRSSDPGASPYTRQICAVCRQL